MTAHALCRCGHLQHRHEVPGFDGECVADGCRCTEFRARDQGTVPARSTTRPAVSIPTSQTIAQPGPAAPTISDLIGAGKRSEVKRTVALAEKLEALALDLRGRLADERKAAIEARERQAQQAAARAEIERLQRQLAAAKAKLGGAAAADHPCPSCPQRFTTAGNLGRHRRDMHGEERTSGDYPCTRDGCGRTFDSAQGRAMHERRAHDGFDPNAARAVS